MKLFVWGTLTSHGGNGFAMKEKWASEYLGPAVIQGLYGELYDVPDEHVPAMDSFEARFGYIRLTADIEQNIQVYVQTPCNDRYYTGDKVAEQAKKDGKDIEIIGPAIKYVDAW